VFIEINKDLLKKTESELDKRWFRDVDRNCDLFIWQDDKKNIVRFQFWIEESLLEWNSDKGFKTGRLDHHTGAFTSYQAPIFRYHSSFDKDVLDSIQSLIKGDLDAEQADDIFGSIYNELEDISIRAKI